MQHEETVEYLCVRCGSQGLVPTPAAGLDDGPEPGEARCPTCGHEVITDRVLLWRLLDPVILG